MIDPELKQYLEGMEARIATQIEAMNARPSEMKDGLGGQLQRMATLLDAQAIQIDRSIAMLEKAAKGK